MRIVSMFTSLGIGGAERLTRAIAVRMRERGHAVAVFALRLRLEEEWPTILPIFRSGCEKVLSVSWLRLSAPAATFAIFVLMSGTATASTPTSLRA